MLKLELPDGNGRGLHVLAIGAHADDIEIGCGGTILRWASEGRLASVRWIVLSATEARADEARAGATAFLAGVERTHIAVHEFRDGYLPFEGAAIKDLFEGLKADEAPDVVLTHRLGDRHQDHRLLGELAWQTFRDQLVLEYEVPKYEGEAEVANLYVELSEAICRRKIDFLQQTFPSQAARAWFEAATFWGLLRLRGVECRAASRHAEAFVCRKAVL